MKRTLQQIEDSYINLGFKEEKFRQALEKDKDYRNLLKQKKAKLTRHFKINDSERKQYILSTDSDLEILAKCKELEKLNLNIEDRRLVELIKAQLEGDWRKSLITSLNQLTKKYLPS
jgi:hypothetical protein